MRRLRNLYKSYDYQFNQRIHEGTNRYCCNPNVVPLKDTRRSGLILEIAFREILTYLSLLSRLIGVRSWMLWQQMVKRSRSRSYQSKTELLRRESKAGMVSYLKVRTSELKYVKSTSSKSSSSSSLHLCIHYPEHIYSNSRQSSELDNSLSFYSLECIQEENLTRCSSDIMGCEKSDFI